MIIKYDIVSICYVNITSYAQNVHRWLTHVPAVACGSLSQRCLWFSPARQTKSIEVHFVFKTQELFLASVAACDKTPTLPPNVIIQWIEVW